MKKLFFILLILSTLSLQSIAQKLFFNTNKEICVELYIGQDEMKQYVVCMVLDQNLNSTDTTVLRRWNTFTIEEQSAWTQQWSINGYRIETVNYPVTYIKQQPFLNH